VANHTKVPAKISDQCRLYAVTGGRIKKAAPTSDLTPFNGKNMDPFRFKQLLSIYGRCFLPAQDGDVLTSLNEFPWLKGMDVVCLWKCLKKVCYVPGSSPLAGVWQSLWGNALPIDFVSDQFQKARNITATKGRVSLLNNIE
jgi:hypothetical protein